MLAGEAQELSDIMQPALVKTMEVSGSEAALIHLYDEDQQALKLIAQRGLPRPYSSQLQKIQVDGTLMAWLSNIRDDIWSSKTRRYLMLSHYPAFKSPPTYPCAPEVKSRDF